MASGRESWQGATGRVPREASVTPSKPMGVRRRIRKSAGRRGRKWGRRCQRFCKILCSPSKMSTLATQCLDEWVTRRVLVIFMVVEVLCSSAAGYFFAVFKDVAQLGFIIDIWFFYSFMMFLRAACGLLGLTACAGRKVTLTKIYWTALACNIPMTLFCCSPLWHCHCTCDPFSQADYDPRLLQCKVLQNFAASSIFPEETLARRLSTVDAPVLELQSHFSFVARIVTSSFGRAVTGSARRLRRSRCNGGLEDFGDGLGRRLTAEDTFDIPLVEHFNATKTGIGWWSKTPKRCFDRVAIRSNENVADAKQTLRSLKNGNSERIERMPLIATSWAMALTQRMEKCIEEDLCGVVEARIQEITDQPSRHTSVAGAKHYGLQICTIAQPIVPVVQAKSTRFVQERTVLFQKNIVFSIKSMRMQLHDQDPSDWCYAVVTLVEMSLLFLDLASWPMFIITLKFLQQRCGDYLQRERQFSVDFSSEGSDEEADDDFQISSASSGSWNRGGAGPATFSTHSSTPPSDSTPSGGLGSPRWIHAKPRIEPLEISDKKFSGQWQGDLQAISNQIHNLARDNLGGSMLDGRQNTESNDGDGSTIQAPWHKQPDSGGTGADANVTQSAISEPLPESAQVVATKSIASKSAFQWF